MIRWSFGVLAVLLSLLAGPVPVMAQDGPGFGFSAGVLDFEDESEVLELGCEYRFVPWKFGLEPHVGLGVTSDLAALAYLGVWRAFPISSRWRLTPSIAVSLFTPGNGEDLGHPIEFRSGLVASRTLRSGAEIGLGIYHLSNGGLGDLNPGANSLLVRYLLTPRNG
jgi:hypothetical protein